MSRTMGNIIAATACAGIIKAMEALVIITPATRKAGLRPNLFKTSRLIRRDKPVFIIAAARMKAPRIKKTAALPKKE